MNCWLFRFGVLHVFLYRSYIDTAFCFSSSYLFWIDHVEESGTILTANFFLLFQLPAFFASLHVSTRSFSNLSEDLAGTAAFNMNLMGINMPPGPYRFYFWNQFNFFNPSQLVPLDRFLHQNA